MFDLSSQFEQFYSDNVILPQSEKNKLRDKKKLNLDRLDSGLEEYNKDNKTNYNVVETREQGSVAMSTVTQNDSNDYDIDVAIIFNADEIEDKGSIAIKNVIVDALKRKCTQMKKDPEALTNCVRVEYAEGYHVDFAIYRRTLQKNGSYTYEHAGSSWSDRDPAAINNWFADEIKKRGEALRKVIRLSKMFCKSRPSWQMPCGLIQSVICDEKLQIYDRLDELFYYTMVSVKNRLLSSVEVYNPTDGKPLLLKEKDRTEMENWKNRLEDKLSNLDILLTTDSEKEAKNAWHDFFNHDFWETSNTTESCAFSNYSMTEEFINKKFNVVDLGYHVYLDCTVTADGFRPQKLSDLLKISKWLSHNRKLEFYIKSTDVPYPYDIYWKIRNVGSEAERRNCIRGQIIKTNSSKQIEHSSFFGPHYVECYLVKNEVCVAQARINVPIE